MSRLARWNLRIERSASVGFTSIVAVARGVDEKPTPEDGNSSRARRGAIVDEKPPHPRSPSMRGLKFVDSYASADSSPCIKNPRH